MPGTLSFRVPNVMVTPRNLTQSLAKRTGAAALADAIARNGWSHADAGDALGCGASTIANRLDVADSKKQLTVLELLRSIAADGPAIANRLLDLVGHRAIPKTCAAAPDALRAAAAAARCTAEVLAAAADGIDADEAARLLPALVETQAELAGLEARLRASVERVRRAGDG